MLGSRELVWSKYSICLKTQNVTLESLLLEENLNRFNAIQVRDVREPFGMRIEPYSFRRFQFTGPQLILQQQLLVYTAPLQTPADMFVRGMQLE